MRFIGATQMRMSIVASLSFLLSLVAMPQASEAAEAAPEIVTDYVMHPCNNCNNTQVLTLGSQLGRGQHYVYDLGGNHLYLLSVECEPNAGGSVCYADEITPAADAQTFFYDYHSAYLQFHSEAFTADVPYNVHSNGPTRPDGGATDNGMVNAFDTVWGSVFDNALRNTLMSPSSYTGAVSTFISVISNSAGFDVPNFTLVVTVHFNDGSVRKYTFNQAFNQFDPIPGSAKDNNGNTLPEHGRQSGNQTFFFGGGGNSGLYNAGNVATLLSVAPPSPPAPLQCTWDSATTTLTCRRAS